MELSHQLGFLEELLEAPRRELLPTFPSNELFSNAWNFDSTLPTQNPSSNFTASSSTPIFEYPFDQTYQYFDGFASVPPEIDTCPFPSMVDQDDDFGLLRTRSFEFDSCKLEMEQQQQQPTNNLHNAQVFCMGSNVDIKRSKSKRAEGQPSKNLMAERRRRKRLNDRLSMLRSIVPKISKMDRTSILGDTIDYMKELLDKIHKLQEEEGEEGINEANLINSLKEFKPNEVQMRNSPKFHVERREIDTRIDVCCSSKPGLLLSTVNTLEALGLEIQQCVISCFNDFSVQASCSETDEQRAILTPEDIKQALFRTAGYGGRCL